MTNTASTMSTERNKLVNLSNFDVNNIIFRKPYTKTTTKPPIMKTTILPLAVKNPDGSVGQFLIRTPKNPLFSFGVSESKNNPQNLVTGYSLPICCWNVDSPTEEEIKWTSKMEEIWLHAKAFLADHPDICDPESAPLKNPLYWKKDKNNQRVQDKGPVVYPKLITSNTDGDLVVRSLFYSTDGTAIDAKTLINQKCKTVSVLLIESIRIASIAKTFQIKLYEAKISILNSSIQRMLEDDEVEIENAPSSTESPRNIPQSESETVSPVGSPKSTEPPQDLSFQSLKPDSDDESEEEEKKKKVVRKVYNKKK